MPRITSQILGFPLVGTGENQKPPPKQQLEHYVTIFLIYRPQKFGFEVDSKTRELPPLACMVGKLCCSGPQKIMGVNIWV